MTDEPTNTEMPLEDDLKALKAKADLLGIKYHTNIGVETLQERIAAHLEETTPVHVTPVAPTPETEAQRRSRLKRESARLVRVRIACMNPHKRDWEGEIFTTGNAVIGTFKKYVPFDVEWHVPQIILTMIEQRRCQVFHTVTDPATRQKTRRGKLIKEFAVEILPSLSSTELKDLAQRQAMASGTAEAA